MQEIYLSLIFYPIATIALIYFCYGLRYGAMYMAIPKKALTKVLNLANVKDQTVYDLGAGYGAYTFKAAEQGAKKVVAVEIDPFKIFKLRQAAKKYLNVTVLKANLLKINYKNADMLYCYLSPPLMQAIAVKAQKEMRQGSIIASVEHQIKDWIPIRFDSENKVYVYKIGTSNI